MPKGSVPPVDLSRKLLEFREVSSAGFVLLHSEYGKFHFRIPDRIVDPEVVLKDLFKLIPVKITLSAMATLTVFFQDRATSDRVVQGVRVEGKRFEGKGVESKGVKGKRSRVRVKSKSV